MKENESEPGTDNPAQIAIERSAQLPAGVDPKLVQAKMAAGLSREQAVETILKQQEHDATQPHEPAPKKPKPGAVVRPPLPEDLDKLTVDELKELAAERDVEVTSDMLKADIIKAIEAS